MRILHVNTSNGRAGADIAAGRLNDALCALGVDSTLLVQHLAVSQASVVSPTGKLDKLNAMFAHNVEQLLLSPYTKRLQNRYFSPGKLSVLSKHIRKMNPDVIHLHWVCGGALSVKAMAHLGKPIVWTMHDMWPFTGGCHYAGNCNAFSVSCGSCPQLGSATVNDLSGRIFRQKTKNWGDLNMVFIGPSRWITELALKSNICHGHRVRNIPNCIDTAKYRPIEQNVARRILGIPDDKKVVLFGAVRADSDPRKGIDLLVQAIRGLSQEAISDSMELVIFGADKPESEMDFGVNCRFMGKLFDDVSLSLLYSSADMYLLPSREDNLPNTLVEAMACGVPCVVNDVGGVRDMVEHKINGYVFEKDNVQDFIRGICWVIENENRWREISGSAVSKINRHFSSEVVGSLHMCLYEEILKNRVGR